MTHTQYIPPGARARRRIGQRFGKWTVIDALGYRPAWPTVLVLRCRCDCGAAGDVMLCNLVSEHSAQCAACGRAQRKAKMLTSRDEIRRAVKVASEEVGVRVVGWSGRIPLFACPCCGRPSPVGRCAGFAKRSEPPRVYPEKLRQVADRVGVSRQRVSQVARQRGWDGMLSYFAGPGSRVTARRLALATALAGETK